MTCRTSGEHTVFDDTELEFTVTSLVPSKQRPGKNKIKLAAPSESCCLSNHSEVHDKL